MIVNSEIHNQIQNLCLEIYQLKPMSSVYLVGSYASGTHDITSDVDLLVFVNKNYQSILVQKIDNLIKLNFTNLRSRIDCKILSIEALSQLKGTDYLMVYSMLKNGKCFQGKKLTLKLLPDKLREALIKVVENLVLIKTDISNKRNFSVNVVLLVTSIKSLYHLEQIFSSKRHNSTMDKLYGNHYKRMKKIHNKNAPKGVRQELNITLTKRSQKSGDYTMLSETFSKVEEYKNKIEVDFYKWYDERNY